MLDHDPLLKRASSSTVQSKSILFFPLSQIFPTQTLLCLTEVQVKRKEEWRDFELSKKKPFSVVVRGPALVLSEVKTRPSRYMSYFKVSI